MAVLPDVKLMTSSDKRRLIGTIVVVGFLSSIIFHYVIGTRLGRGYPYSTFLFRPDDRFNDFFNIFRATIDLNPYASSVSVYFPFSYFPIYPLTFFKKYFAYAIFAILFLTFLPIAEYRCIQAKGKADRFFTMFTLTALSYPVLFLLDRGNLECLVFTFIALFVYCYKEGKDNAAALFLSGAVAMKLYPAVFCVLLISDRRWKPFLLVVVSTLVLTLGSAALLEGGVSASLVGLQRNLLLFKAQYLNSLHGLQHNSSLYVPAALMATTLSLTGILSKGYPFFAILLFIVAAAFVTFREDAYWKRVAILSYMMILLPQVSYDYKLIHIFLPLLLFLGTETCSRFDKAYAVLFGLLLIPKDYYYLINDISINGILNSLLMLAFIGFIVADKRQESPV